MGADASVVALAIAPSSQTFGTAGKPGPARANKRSKLLNNNRLQAVREQWRASSDQEENYVYAIAL
ncbi:hypothetical protein GCM10017643_25100 [Ancylobacter dichloromethanicus]|uniref:Uncharacterized protein n=1 Tax=Ancylobacter dichloromethanicus TaxID=518825 RepID=A0A9W6JAP7_9HYPH|nr:hypothetical protein GCM10017643_25100 [Ancylobacter dichloromethanicus]